MVSNRDMQEMLFELADPIARAQGLVVVDVTFKRGGPKPRILVVLDKPGGVTIGDCQRFNNLFGARLDLDEDKLPDGYHLEVSSPGLDRTLEKDRHFQVFRGRTVEVRTYAPVDGKKEFRGTLEGLSDGHVMLVDEGGESRDIPREMIARCKLHYDIEDLM